jgi:hypothetical protein
MIELTAAELADLAEPFLGKGAGKQEYELALALARLGEPERPPDLGLEDLWLRARDNIAARLSSQWAQAEAFTAHVLTAAAAEQVLQWASAAGLNSDAYRISLAVLTAMAVDKGIKLMGGAQHGNGSESAGK